MLLWCVLLVICHVEICVWLCNNVTWFLCGCRANTQQPKLFVEWFWFSSLLKHFLCTVLLLVSSSLLVLVRLESRELWKSLNVFDIFHFQYSWNCELWVLMNSKQKKSFDFGYGKHQISDENALVIWFLRLKQWFVVFDDSSLSCKLS